MGMAESKALIAPPFKYPTMKPVGIFKRYAQHNEPIEFIVNTWPQGPRNGVQWQEARDPNTDQLLFTVKRFKETTTVLGIGTGLAVLRIYDSVGKAIIDVRKHGDKVHEGRYYIVPAPDSELFSDLEDPHPDDTYRAEPIVLEGLEQVTTDVTLLEAIPKCSRYDLDFWGASFIR